MVLTAVAKKLQWAEALKESILKMQDILAENDMWTMQQQLLNTYRQVLILDLEYALDKKVEQDLWNHAVKNFISKLQPLAKDKKHPKRSDAQALLTTCLETAAGFYLRLLQEICSAFHLDLPFRRNNMLFGLSEISRNSEAFAGTMPKKSSTYYLCQHCLVHLGDIARYRNQNRQAEIFYKYAMMIIPSSGQPYNQLAILEASRGDKVSVVYYYVRAIALSHPFSAAASNLSKALQKHCDDVVKMDGNGKLSTHEYLAAFLKLHGLLHSFTELDKAEKLVQILTTSLTAHIATESLPAWKLVQMVVINIFALSRLDDSKVEELTVTEKRVLSLISHYLAGCLNAFLLPVYTIKSDDALLEYFAMPAIKLTLDWIRLRPHNLNSPGFTSRRQIWPSLCCLFRRLQNSNKNFKLKMHGSVPLPEDRDLRGFSPFDELFMKFDYHAETSKRSAAWLSKLRAARVLDFGAWLAEQNPPLVTKSLDDTGITRYEPLEPPQFPGDLLKELEQLTQGKTSLNNGSHTGTGSSTPDSSAAGYPASQDTLPEKKGILKSEAVENRSEPKSGTSRTSRNVALSSLHNQKSSEDVKQVKFRTPSPQQTKSSSTHKAQPLPKKLNSKSELKKQELPLTTAPDEDPKLAQQKKLLEVLTGNSGEKTSEKNKIRDVEQSQQKQQALSALFDQSKSNEQLQAMSGVLNLNKQQQELLTISKQPPPPQAAAVQPRPNASLPPRLNNIIRPPGPASVAEKMEAARKEYQDAMYVLQQRQIEQSESNMYPVEGQHPPYTYERMFTMPPTQQSQPQPPPPPQHVFVQLNQPMMGMNPMQPFAFKVQPGVIMPFRQEPEHPPMPPASWWTQQPPPMMGGGEPPGYRQPPPTLNTYSLWEPDHNRHMPSRIVNQQSFWSGPGPSPLERLLEQQRKQMRDSDSNT